MGRFLDLPVPERQLLLECKDGQIAILMLSYVFEETG